MFVHKRNQILCLYHNFVLDFVFVFLFSTRNWRSFGDSRSHTNQRYEHIIQNSQTNSALLNLTSLRHSNPFLVFLLQLNSSAMVRLRMNSFGNLKHLRMLNECVQFTWFCENSSLILSSCIKPTFEFELQKEKKIDSNKVNAVCEFLINELFEANFRYHGLEIW